MGRFHDRGNGFRRDFDTYPFTQPENVRPTGVHIQSRT